MKCKSCGAEIKEGNSVCEYCGSAVEQAVTKAPTIIRDNEHPVKGVARVIGKVIVALACIWAVLIIITLVITLNSDIIKNGYEHPASTNDSDTMPKNETELIGQVISCDAHGVASIEYQGDTYTDIKILDDNLIQWVNDTDRSIDAVEICFATNEKGNISELGLLSPDFFIVAQDGTRYDAIRDNQAISFVSALPLKTGHYYRGYFSYPDLELYSGAEQSVLTLTYMDLKCDDKETVIEQEYYTGKNISVYKILTKGQWCYCDQETYETVQEGDSLSKYEIFEDQEAAFIIRE